MVGRKVPLYLIRYGSKLALLANDNAVRGEVRKQGVELLHGPEMQRRARPTP